MCKIAEVRADTCQIAELELRLILELQGMLMKQQTEQEEKLPEMP